MSTYLREDRNRFYRDLTGPVHVLIAEDDADMRKLLAERLRREGFEVLEARDGRELVELIAAQVLGGSGDRPPIDLVISDVRMPGMSGLDALASLRRHDWGTPFIVITAFGDADTHAEARRLGAAAVFDKPFDVDDLCTAALLCLR
jgi:DNA-binding response OmpR family regulator